MLPVDSDTLRGFRTPGRLAIPRGVFHSFVFKNLCKTYREIRTSKLNLASFVALIFIVRTWKYLFFHVILYIKRNKEKTTLQWTTTLIPAVFMYSHFCKEGINASLQ
jgi:hypothetical protein